MGYVVRMPQLGMTMEEGVVVEWPVDEGAEFEEGDLIAVVESEKTTNDVLAREDGVIVERFVDVEEPVGPGDPIAYVGDADEEVPEDVRAELAGGPAAGDTEAEVAEGTEAPSASATPSGDGATLQVAKISPRARSYASEAGIPAEALASIEGTGPEGAVIEADVIEAEAAGTLSAAGASAGAAVAGTEAVAAGAGRDVYEAREASRLRQTIARRMTASATQIPQVTLNRSVPIEATLGTREQLESDLGVKPSLTDFLLAASADALTEHPEFNAVYEDGVHKLARNVNIGVAIDVEGGLVSPVIRGVDRMGLTELNQARSSLVERTLAGEYTGDDLADGTFTLTNLGHFGVDSFDPLINPPEVAILGVGGISHEYDPEADDHVRHVGLSLTFDHRAVDGADAARFLDAIADALAHPLRLVDLGPPGFREVPSSASGHRQASARSSGGMSATVGARGWEWSVDEPEEVGGTDSAPNPVEQFLGSLSACLTLMINNIAERREVPIEHVSVSADATPEVGHIERIDVDVSIVSPADEADVERVVGTADRACYVSGVIGDDVEKSIAISVESP